MDRTYLDIARKWGVVLAWDIDRDDLDELASWLDALSCPKKDIADALRVIMRKDTGFTFSNPDLRMSLVCIGYATSDEQWLDTLIHELDHVQATVCRYYDVALDSEDAAYLIGYMARLVRKQCR